MRILILSAEPPYPPTHGGTRLCLFNGLKALSNTHGFTLLSLCESAEDHDHLREVQKFCRYVEGFDRTGMSKPYGWRDRFRLPFHRLAFTPQLQAAIHTQLSTVPYDLVHVDGTRMGVYTPLLLGHRKLIVATDAASLGARSLLKRAVTLRDKIERFYRWHQIRHFEQTTYREYDACVVVAERDRETIRHLCPSLPVSVLPVGVDMDYFQPRRDPNSPTLLFTGTMDYLPNMDAVRWFSDDILALIHHQKPEAQFVVVGRNATPDIEALGTRQGISIRGFAPDIRVAHAEASVFVCPMRLGSGMKCKMLEAMAMGQAIVTTTEGAEGITGRDGEHYLVADSPQAFAKAVLRLLRDSGLRHRLGVAARSFVEDRYSWTKRAQQLHELYLRVGQR